MRWNGGCVAVRLTIVTVGVRTHKSWLWFFVVVPESAGGCINTIKHKVSNSRGHLTADWWWSADMYLEIDIGVDQCDCASATGNSKLDTVSGNEDWRSCARKYDLPLTMVD